MKGSPKRMWREWYKTMSKSNKEVTIETLVKTIEEMTATLNTLADKINYLEKNVAFKPKPQWPIKDKSIQDDSGFTKLTVEFFPDGTVYIGDCTIDNIQNAIKKIHDKDASLITKKNERLHYQQEGRSFCNMIIGKDVLLKDWITDYSEPDKNKWLDNNYIYSDLGNGPVNKKKRSHYVDYVTRNSNLKMNNTRLIFVPHREYYEIVTTDDRIKSFIMRNEVEFYFIRKTLDKDNEKNNEWTVHTKNVYVIEQLFDTI